MRVIVSEEAVEIDEVDVLTALAVVTALDAPSAMNRLRLEGLCRQGMGQDYAWLDVEELARRADPGETGWRESYDAMIAYAARSGWTSVDATLVRAHLEAP